MSRGVASPIKSLLMHFVLSDGPLRQVLSDNRVKASWAALREKGGSIKTLAINFTRRIATRWWNVMVVADLKGVDNNFYVVRILKVFRWIKRDKILRILRILRILERLLIWEFLELFC